MKRDFFEMVYVEQTQAAENLCEIVTSHNLILIELETVQIFPLWSELDFYLLYFFFSHSY